MSDTLETKWLGDKSLSLSNVKSSVSYCTQRR